MKIGSIVADGCGIGVSFGAGVDVEVNSIVTKACGIGTYFEGQESPVTNSHDRPYTGVHFSPQKGEQHQDVAPKTRWKKTKRFFREASINALSAALVSGATSISTAS